MEQQKSCRLPFVSFWWTLLTIICVLDEATNADHLQPLLRRNASAGWTKMGIGRKGPYEMGSGQVVRPQDYPFLKERDTTRRTSESRLVKRAISQPPSSSPIPWTPTTVQPTCPPTTFNLTVMQRYTFPDIFTVGNTYLSLIISPKATCSPQLDPGNSCLELVSPGGPKGWNISMKFFVERNYSKMLDDCRKSMSVDTCSLICHKGNVTLPDTIDQNIVPNRDRRDLEDEPVKCGLAYRMNSPTQYDIYAAEEHCPMKVTHECLIEITVSNTEGINQTLLTTFKLYDENESPVCRSPLIIRQSNSETFASCFDRDEHLTKVCGAPGCNDHAQNSYAVLNKPKGVRLVAGTNEKQGLEILVDENSEPFNMTVRVSQSVIGGPVVNYHVYYMPEPTPTPTSKVAEGWTADVAFVIYAKSSKNLELLIEFIRMLLIDVNAKDENARFAFIFNYNLSIGFNRFPSSSLQHFFNLILMEAHVIQQSHDGFDLIGILRYSRSEIFTLDAAARPDHAKALIIITDSRSGQNQMEVNKQALRTAHANIAVYMIGVEEATKSEMINAAISPENTFHYSDYNELLQNVVSVSDQIGSIGISQPATTSPAVSTSTEGAIEPSAPPISLAERWTADVAFVLYTNPSKSSKDLVPLIDFIRLLLNNIDAEGGNARFAFFFNGHPMIDFNSHPSKRNLNEIFTFIRMEADGIKISHERFDLLGMLRLANSEIFTLDYAARPDHPNALIIITDSSSGQNQVEVNKEALRTAQANIAVYMIGVEEATKSEMTNAAISPKNTFHYADFNELLQNVASVRDQIGLFSRTPDATTTFTEATTIIQKDAPPNVRIVKYEGWSVRLNCPPRIDSCEHDPKVTWHGLDGTVIGCDCSILLKFLRVEDTGMYICKTNGNVSQTFDIHVYRRDQIESPMSYDKFTTSFNFSVRTDAQALTSEDLEVAGIDVGVFLKRAIGQQFPNVESIQAETLNLQKLRQRNDSSEDFYYYHEYQCKLSVTEGFDNKVQNHREEIIKAINYRQGDILPLRTNSTVIPTPFNSGQVQELSEGEELRINFSFYILETPIVPKYQLLWQFGDQFLDVPSSYQGEASIITNVSISTVYSPVLRLSIRTVNATLHFKKLKPTVAGEYRCHLYLDLETGPEIATVSKSIPVIHPRPTVAISPLTATVAFNSTVPYSCHFRYFEMLRVVVNNETVKELWKRGGAPFKWSDNVTTGSSGDEDIVLCYARGPMGHVVQEEIVIRSLPEDDETPMCETTYDRRGTLWMATAQNTSIKNTCPENYLGIVTRQCSNNGTWLRSNYSACKRENLVAVEEQVEFLNILKKPSPKQVEDVTSGLAQSVNGSTAPLHGNDINQVVDLLSQLGNVVREKETEDGTETVALLSDSALVDVAGVTDTLMSANQTDWKEANDDDMASGPAKSGTVKATDLPAGRLIMAMDQLVSSTLNDSKMTSQTIVKENLVIKRAKVNSSEDIRFPIPDEEEYQEHDGWVNQSQSSAFLSHVALSQSEDAVNNYAVLLYRGINKKLRTKAQAPNKTYTRSICDPSPQDLSVKEVITDVLSLSINAITDDLSPPLDLTFPIPEDGNGPVCGFLDTSTGTWSSDGCQTEILGDGLVQCLCDHLTNFAVLMSPAGTDIASTHHHVLSIITKIGCSISIICLIITILAYALFWRFIKNDLSVLHINLSACLIVSYFVFMTGINQICPEALCTFIAALLHYVLLVVFFLMLSEGVEIMMSVSVVFARKSALWKLLVASYGIPAILVAISLAATKVEGYRSDHYCWLSWKTGALWAFAGPALLVILTNCVLAVIILKVMAGTASMKNQEEIEKAKIMAKALLTLSSVLGIGWVFGILSVNSQTIAFQYLFALLNCLQGLFIFIFHCVLSRQIRHGFSVLKRRLSSRSYDYSTTKSGTGPSAHSMEQNEMRSLSVKDDSEKII